MQNSKRFALLLLASAAAMAGFDGGCGQIDPQPIPQPQPSPSPTPPPPAACVDLLDEAACTAQASCRAIFVDVACTCPACPPGALECPPCDCPPPSSTFVGCEERSGCESLGEAACNADPTCESVYAQPACLSAPEDAAPCAEPGCGRCTEPATFAGCQDRVVCPAVLCAPCEFGVAVDQNGCATCECLPPPNECAGLDEATCIQIPGCDPVYGIEPGTGTGGGSGGAAPPACDCAGAPDCGCEDRIMPPPPPAYSGCVPTAVRCEDLSEQTCQMTPGCHPEYAYPPCAAFCPPEDPNCGGTGAPIPPACDPVFTYCAPDQVVTGCTSDFDCLNGYCEYGAQPGTGTRPAGDAAQPEDPGVPVPPPSGICVAVSCGDQGPVLCDAIPPVCGPGQVAGALGGCWSCFDARTCQPVNGPSQCVSDFDCFGGYCEQGPVSGGGSSGGAEPPSDAFPVPPPGGYCVYPVCGDGSEIACDAIPPTCGVGQVAGAANGCWACYDARSCQPVNGPQGCFDDSQCPNGYCDGGINGGGATPPGSGSGGADPSRPALPPEGMCVFPSCDDGSPLMCRMHTPVCAPGTVVSIINGCYECRDARTCQPPVSSCDGSTTDCG